jgi:hypothetical protein
VSPDGASLACLYNGDVSFLDISSGQVLRSLLKGVCLPVVRYGVHVSSNNVYAPANKIGSTCNICNFATFEPHQNVEQQVAYAL